MFGHSVYQIGGYMNRTNRVVEKFEIEVGDEARVHSLTAYHGTKRGAVRAALKRWRARGEGETSLVLRRPGCRPIRFLTEGGD